MPQKNNNSKQTKVSAKRNGDKPQTAYFLSLELENIRCFGERQRIDFSDSDNKLRQWTIILGNNGTGKTTLLQSLVAMIPSIDYRKSSSPKYTTSFSFRWNFVRQQFKYGKFQASFSTNHFRDKEKITPLEYECKINLTEDIDMGEFGIFPTQSFQSSFILEELEINCFAYGATRKAGETSLSEKNEDSVYMTLFDETALLINPEEWLLQADYASRRKYKFALERKHDLELVKKILIGVPPEKKGALPEIDDIKFSERKSGRNPRPIVEFHTPYGWVESKNLSLGYRTSMAWIVDFASRMFDLYPESENPLAEPAVVLIDEIDLHLHPKWQRELIDYLTNLFPNTQFIVTTHSPLIVQAAAARDANIVVCRREGDHVVIDQSVEAVRNWRTDQILTSDLFDLPSDRAKDIEPLMEERQKILSKAKLTKKDEKRLEELEKEIGSVPVMENPKYDEAMDIILRAAEKLGKENGTANDSHKKASKNPANSKR